jgi:PAS domain S-box-containing protein
MADGVLVLDAFGRVVDVNPAAARALGRSHAALVGQPLADVLPRHPALSRQPLEVDSDEERLEVTLPVEGRLRYFDARRQPLPDRSGRPAGALVVLRDVTERRAAETQLRHLLAERSRIASALQASLLPATLPEVPGARLAAQYRPAGDGREIGGDFYDVFPVGRHYWGVVLGDVSGKGAEAAAVTAQVRYTIRTLAAERSRPSELLASLNEVLLQESTEERYCTLVYGLAEPGDAGWRLHLSLAGHHRPLVRRAQGLVEAVGREGTALGLLPDPDLYDSVVELRHGDVLCLFTDGLVEARCGLDLFGEERAAAVLADLADPSAQSAARGLTAAALAFRGEPLSDDLAVLCLQAADGTSLR